MKFIALALMATATVSAVKLNWAEEDYYNPPQHAEANRQHGITMDIANRQEVARKESIKEGAKEIEEWKLAHQGGLWNPYGSF